jgi:hypothetical protein
MGLDLVKAIHMVVLVLTKQWAGPGRRTHSTLMHARQMHHLATLHGVGETLIFCGLRQQGAKFVACADCGSF